MKVLGIFTSNQRNTLSIRIGDKSATVVKEDYPNQELYEQVMGIILNEENSSIMLTNFINNNDKMVDLDIESTDMPMVNMHREYDFSLFQNGNKNSLMAFLDSIPELAGYQTD